jgi:hypothetical protein
VAGQVRMAAQDRMGVRFGWRRGVDRGAGLGPAAAGDSVRGGGAWLAWLACLGELWVALGGSAGEPPKKANAS